MHANYFENLHNWDRLNNAIEGFNNPSWSSTNLQHGIKTCFKIKGTQWERSDFEHKVDIFWPFCEGLNKRVPAIRRILWEWGEFHSGKLKTEFWQWFCLRELPGKWNDEPCLYVYMFIERDKREIKVLPKVDRYDWNERAWVPRTWLPTPLLTHCL